MYKALLLALIGLFYCNHTFAATVYECRSVNGNPSLYGDSANCSRMRPTGFCQSYGGTDYGANASTVACIVLLLFNAPMAVLHQITVLLIVL